MGKKLTAAEIGQHVIYSPSTGFDQCSKCQGVESQGLMRTIDEDADELICDECVDDAVHQRHCDQGEYEGSCKYGEDDCPVVNSEEPKSRIWTVEVCRTATAFKIIKVVATTEQEACDNAIDAAGDEEFGSGEADYSTPDGAY